MSGRLFIVGTPIGNLEDITLRALRVLKEADLIACEDTRRTLKLLNHYGIKNPLLSYHEFNERTRAAQLVKKLKEGLNVALVSDAGMPGISDPGFQAIRASIEEGLPIVPVPGPSAVLAALVISGLPVHRFAFEGFLPERSGARRRLLLELKDEARTLVFFESPRRLKKALQDISEIFGNRKAAIARELTKKFETVYRGFLEELIREMENSAPKGEMVLVIEGNSGPQGFEDLSLPEHVARVMDERKVSRKEAVKIVSSLRGVSKREVYQASLNLP